MLLSVEKEGEEGEIGGRCAWFNYDVSEVERQGQSKQVNYTQYSSFFSRKEEDLPLGVRTNNTLLSRRVSYKLSYQSNSSGRGAGAVLQSKWAREWYRG